MSRKFLCWQSVPAGLLLLCCLLTVWSSPARAAERTAELALAEKTLANDPQWLALLHMRRGLDGRYRSEVDAGDFFLSQRADDAAAELQATLQALRAPASGPRSAWCRFPARAQFLAAHFSLRRPAALDCAELDYWRGQFFTDELVLVYPEPYLRNVASVFGHTFFRFDAADKQQHPLLLSKGVSYYADVASAGGAVSYIAKGLAGGFGGVMEVAPYFQKLRKYSDNEDRDIREYRLALTPAQIRLLLDHIWEVRGHSFDYFFLDENCSYRLVALLDVVSPTHRVREQFDWHAMPVDTVTALRDEQLIASETYVPSARKLFYAQLAQLDEAQRAQLTALAQGELHYEDVDDLRVMALAADYSAMQARVDEAHAPLHAVQLNRLIRRQYESGELLPQQMPVIPHEDPAVAGHRQTRLQFGAVQQDGSDAALLGWRAAYHDFHDPQRAYQQGVQLHVLDAEWRAFDTEHEDEFALERMRWFALESYQRRDAFFQPASWGFALSRQREWLGDSFADGERELLHVAEGYRGASWGCGGVWLCHAELLGGALAGSALDLGWTARLGARAGLLYQTSTWTFSANAAQQHYLAGEQGESTTLQLEAGRALSRNLSLHMGWQQQRYGDDDSEQFSVSLRHFF